MEGHDSRREIGCGAISGDGERIGKRVGGSGEQRTARHALPKEIAARRRVREEFNGDEIRVQFIEKHLDSEAALSVIGLDVEGAESQGCPVLLDLVSPGDDFSRNPALGRGPLRPASSGVQLVVFRVFANGTVGGESGR